MDEQERFKIFCLCADAIIKNGITDVEKTVSKIETAYLVAQESYDRLFGLKEEEAQL
jgi:hypothetical protein